MRLVRRAGRHAGRDLGQGEALIRDLSFPCKHNRCLTQTLHFLDKTDAVAPVALPLPAVHRSRPAEPFSGSDGAAAAHAPEHEDSDITVIGPTEHLPLSPSRDGAETPPPDGERERLIWAMEQWGWVQAKAAKLLRITPRKLGYALQKNRIEVRKF